MDNLELISNPDFTYKYKSPIGSFYIRYNPKTLKWELWFGDGMYGDFDNTIGAADNVYLHATGCYEWDKLDCKIDDVPTDIYEWERVPNTKRFDI
jgi:sarcosine oxidase delta subunit